MYAHCEFQNLRTYYRNEKKKLSSFRRGTGARDLVPKWEHFAHLQFLDDTIKPLDSTSNLDYMKLEINAVRIFPSDVVEDLFENVVEPPSIPCSESQSEQPQWTRVSTSTPRLSTVTPLAKNRKVDSSHEDFYEIMLECLGIVGKKTVNETFATFIASELDILPCSKQQAAIRRKLCYTIFDCLE
ncbi:hypothetical protein TNIN_162691 [Trichonephila inaurata madagascariensis]|uniref:Uncharacterized protein n=1 Tax=Trichonephila inaurata madagascariensis TaxID=2747483 RepID=A0A8X7CDA6_9ARAC|nr:hypothetical protein TNIN_162691 [Trichonephila inaurata madagascariensis]